MICRGKTFNSVPPIQTKSIFFWQFCMRIRKIFTTFSNDHVYLGLPFTIIVINSSPCTHAHSGILSLFSKSVRKPVPENLLFIRICGVLQKDLHYESFRIALFYVCNTKIKFWFWEYFHYFL